jgi:FlaA1/EpsC-like NDP-sugar epimerase
MEIVVSRHRYTGAVTLPLATIDWHSFLGRPPLPSPPATALISLTRESILITGAGGSIGSALALRLAAHGARLILLESSEAAVYELRRAFSDYGGDDQPAFYLGSAADHPLLEEIFALHRPHLVFHAAAFKHVPLLEEQPLAAVANNVLATRELVAAASAHSARIVLLSTDKAVTPASVMGATKRVAEQIALANGSTVLRLANVLASRGSVAEVFAEQIATSRSLTVTSPAARRYFITLDEAVDLLLAAASEPVGPSLFVPDLRASHFIADLARFMARNLAPDREIPIEFTRLRAGDKESEALWSPAETPQATQTNGLVPIDSPSLPQSRHQHLLEELEAAAESREVHTALTILRELVPDYTPSHAVRAVCSRIATPVQDE